MLIAGALWYVVCVCVYALMFEFYWFICCSASVDKWQTTETYQTRNKKNVPSKSLIVVAHVFNECV